MWWITLGVCAIIGLIVGGIAFVVAGEYASEFAGFYFIIGTFFGSIGGGALLGYMGWIIPKDSVGIGIFAGVISAVCVIRIVDLLQPGPNDPSW